MIEFDEKGVLEKAREAAGKTIFEVAEHIGLKPSELRDIEGGKSKLPDSDIMMKLGELYGVLSKPIVKRVSYLGVGSVPILYMFDV